MSSVTETGAWPRQGSPNDRNKKTNANDYQGLPPLAWNLSLSPRLSGWIAATVRGPGAGEINGDWADACGDGPRTIKPVCVRWSGGGLETSLGEQGRLPAETEIPGDPIPGDFLCGSCSCFSVMWFKGP